MRPDSSPSGNITDNSALNLTFGIEIECVLLEDPAKHDDWAPNGLNIVHEALNKPLWAECATCKKSHHFDLKLKHPSVPQVLDSHLNDHIDRNAKKYSEWSIVGEHDLLCSELSSQLQQVLRYDLKQHYIEIVSRILSSHHNLETEFDPENPSHRHEITYEEEIRAVTDALNNHFNGDQQKPAWGLIVNRNCGFHVHVGNGDQGLPLQTIKNALSLYIANEASIDSLHATHRITGASFAFQPGLDTGKDWRERRLFKDMYNLPWSAHSAFMAINDWRVPKGLQGQAATRKRVTDFFPFSRFNQIPDLRAKFKANDIPARLDVVRHTQQLPDLQDLQIDFCHHSTVSLENLTQHHPEKTIDNYIPKHTIEFRQHAGTLDHKEMHAWIDVLLRLIQHAHLTPETTLLQTCTTQWRNPNFSPLHFLQTLGLQTPDRTFKHYKSVLGTRRHPHAGPSWTQQCLQQNASQAQTRVGHIHDVAQESARIYGDSRDFEGVRFRVQRKFLAGCYGQFERRYLDGLAEGDDAPYPEERERLEMGWIAPVVGA